MKRRGFLKAIPAVPAADVYPSMFGTMSRERWEQMTAEERAAYLDAMNRLRGQIEARH